MSELDAPPIPTHDLDDGRHEALVVPVVFSALAGAAVLATFTAWFRDLGAPVALAVLALLGVLGLFFVLALAAGFVRFGEPSRPQSLLETYAGSQAEGLLLTGPDGRVSFANRAFWSLIGRPTAGGNGREAPLRPAQALAIIPGAAEALYRLNRAADLGEAWEEVIEVARTGEDSETGRERVGWLRVTVSHHLDPAMGRISAWRLTDVTRDHTRQAETVQRLKRSIDQLDGLAAGLVSVAADGRITYMNATLADWLGFDRRRIDEGRLRLADFLSEEGIAAIEHAQAGARPGDAVTAAIELLREDGARVPARLICRRLGAAGGLGLALVINQAPGDRADDGAHTAEARFARFFHAAPIAIATIDREGRIGSANAAFTRMFFRAEAAVSPAGTSILERVSQESRGAVGGALGRLAGERTLAPVEIAFGEAGRRTGQLFLSAVADPGSEREAAILYAVETTEQKELEAQFAQSQKMQAIGQLAGGVAHDINNVLTVIIGFADLLIANGSLGSAYNDLMEIKGNANRAAGLVRQLLAFSRRQTLRPEVLSLNEVISDLTVFLKRSLGEKVKLEREYGRDLWSVKADQAELGRVFVNLAVNASDAMPEGGQLAIRTSNETIKAKTQEIEPGDYVVCAVTDTGTGMPPEVMAKIFEPFFTTKEVGKGTGLGLSTVYGIVKQTGGYIYCDSTPGKGTTFRIYLPRYLPGSGEEDALPRGERKEREKDKPRDLTGSGTVLLVEDEDAVRRFAVRALRRQGYAVLEAGSGVEALEVMAAHDGKVDVVVSDVVMPEMDGPTLLKELRRSHPDMKIIFMSGYAEDALKSLEGGEEFAFLSKPFQLTDLVTKVKEIMGS